jgi:hypothetical protein
VLSLTGRLQPSAGGRGRSVPAHSTSRSSELTTADFASEYALRSAPCSWASLSLTASYRSRASELLQEIPEPQVVQPLGSSVLDAVQVSYSVPRSSFEDEDVAPVLTCVASVDPTGSFQSGADRVEVLKHGQTSSKINDRLREKPEHRRRADVLDADRNVLQALRHPVPQ